MLKFLLDEQLTPKIATQMAMHRPDIPMISLQKWEEGRTRGLDDPRLLMAAREQRLTLFTYDQHTIAPLLRTWGERAFLTRA